MSPPYFSFVSSLSTIKVPNNVHDALCHPADTWELVHLPPGKKHVGCRWVYCIEVGPIDAIDSLKARLIAKGCT